MTDRDTSPVVDDEFPHLDPDPEPVARRRPGRPRKTTATAPKKAVGRPKGSTNTTRRPTVEQMREKVASEIYTYLALAVAGWELADPECAAPLTEMVRVPGHAGEVERLQAITDRIVGIIARRPAWLETISKSGVIGEIAIIGHLLYPVVRQVMAHHGPTGRGHADNGEVTNFDALYPAYTTGSVG